MKPQIPRVLHDLIDTDPGKFTWALYTFGPRPVILIYTRDLRHFVGSILDDGTIKFPNNKHADEDAPPKPRTIREAGEILRRSLTPNDRKNSSKADQD